MRYLEKSVLEIPINTEVVMRSVWKGMYYISMESSWLNTYFTSAMGDVDNWFLENLDEECSLIAPLASGCSTYALEKFYNVV